MAHPRGVGRQGRQRTAGYATRTAVLCAAMVLSLFAALSLSLAVAHAETGHPIEAAVHVHEAAAHPGADSPGDHLHGHGEVDQSAWVSASSEGPQLSADGQTDDGHDHSSHHHHLVEVDAGVLLAVSVPAPDRAGPPRPMTATSVPASLSDGGGRPD